MAAKAARKRPARLSHHNNARREGSDGVNDLDQSSPTKQLRDEAASMGQTMSAEDGAEPLLTGATANLESKDQTDENATHEESSNILKRATSRRRSSKPVKEAGTRLEETEHNIYDIPEDERLGGRARMTRGTRTAVTGDSKQRKDSAITATATQLRRDREQRDKWSAFEDGTLLVMISNGAGLSQIHESLPDFTLAEIKTRLVYLQEQAKPEAGNRWSPGEDNILACMRDVGAEVSTIHAVLAHRTEPAIRQRHANPARSTAKKRSSDASVEERPNKKSKGAESKKTRATATHGQEAARDTRIPDRSDKNRRRSGHNQRTSASTKSAKASAMVGGTRSIRERAMPGHARDIAIDVLQEPYSDDKANDLEGEQHGGDHDEEEDVDEWDGTADSAGVDIEPDIVVPDPDADLFGETERFVKSLKAAENHMARYKEDFSTRGRLELPKVKSVRQTKTRIRDLYRKLSYAKDTIRIQGSIDRSLQHLKDQVRHFDGELAACRDKAVRQRLVTQVKKFVFADLLSVLSAALKVYSAGVLHDDEGQLWHLDCWIQICQIADMLHRTSQSDSWTAVKISSPQSVRTSMAIPLPKASEGLQRERNKLLLSQNRSNQVALQLQVSQRKMEEEEIERRLVQEYNEKYRRLGMLFARRIKAARVKHQPHSKFATRGKTYFEWRKDREPFDEAPELDANGEPMERLPIFTKRQPGSRPPKQSIWEVDGSDWDDEEKTALLKGLKAYPGPNVFYQVFEQYGQPGQELGARSVSEILRMTASIREGVLEQLERRGQSDDDCPTWLRDIRDLDLMELL